MQILPGVDLQNYKSRFRLQNGKWAYIQSDEFAQAARSHIDRVRRAWDPPGHFYHFNKGGHVAALQLHMHSPWLAKLDLSQFFSRVSRHRLTRCLKRAGYSFNEAEEFAMASTVWANTSTKQFSLPFGFAQSPILAALALDMSELGRCLRQEQEQNVKLSVYVDDIIVSGDTEETVSESIRKLRISAHRSQFPLNEAKCIGPSDSLRAFNIRIGGGSMVIEADRFEEMCQVVLYSGAGTTSDGILSYVHSVNDLQAEQMMESFPRSFPNLRN